MLVLNGDRVSVLEDGKVLEMDCGDGCTENVLNGMELYT